jgi:hypothetical protein
MLHYRIDADKLIRVTDIFNQGKDRPVADAVLEVEICADWNEGAEHQAWIDQATPEEIADWLASFYQS